MLFTDNIVELSITLKSSSFNFEWLVPEYYRQSQSKYAPCSAWLVITAAFMMQLYSYFATNLVPLQSVRAFRSLEHILGVQISCFNIHSDNLKVHKNFYISIERFTTSSAYLNVSNDFHILQYFVFCQEDPSIWSQLYLKLLRMN